MDVTSHRLTPWPALLLALLPSSVRAQSLVGFEGLASPPALDGRSSFSDANGGSLVHAGMTWDSRLNVLGASHRTGNDPSNPLSSIPHGGSFFVTNEAYPGDGDGISITPAAPGAPVLVGAWFGQVEYYGYGHGAMTITLEALNGGTVLDSASVSLVANTGNTPLPMAYLDASSFATLTGVTGYRIRQDPLLAGSRYWSADDFTFAPVPEPPGIMAGAGAGLVALATWRRTRRARRPASGASLPA